MFGQGDIVVVKFPFTDGSEFKKRPVLIVSNATANKTGDFLVVQITSKENYDGLSVPMTEKDSLIALPLKSYIRVHKLFTVHHSLILSKITTAKPKLLKLVANAVYKVIQPI